jgi:hypothetical protein
MHKSTLALLLFCGLSGAYAVPLHAAVTAWNSQTQGAFAMSLARGPQGHIWVGTEDNGVWRCDADGVWTQFTTKDGLGDDNAYALAVDKKGRVWTGHLNHGISVWNGRAWRNYRVLDGPNGERVFDIAVCPTDGDVWIATNAGLTRYSAAKNQWLGYSRASGLPADAINALAFDTNGDLYAGTQCDGLGIARAAEGYKQWQVVSGPATLPTVAQGDGLPSSLINDVLVARDGTVYVATTCGLASSTDKGKTWHFMRGSDWLNKHKGLYRPAPLRGDEVLETMLLQDYVTALAEDENGLLWIGFRQQGYEVLNPRTQQLMYLSSMEPQGGVADDYVRAILPLPVQSPLIARYGGDTGGVSRPARVLKSRQSATQTESAPQDTPASLPADGVAFPAVNSASNATTVQSMLKRVQAMQKPLSPGEGLYIGADWSTQGDWVGRYGRQFVVLCGMQNPTSNQWSAAPEFKVSVDTGPHVLGGGGVYSYVTEVHSQNPRALHNPLRGTRRIAEWNDGSWQADRYPLAFEGPDLWATVEVPAGVHRVSLHFYNKDGHSGANRYRDYLLELKTFHEDLQEADAAPTLARARVLDFWGGVYHQFAVCGPGKFRIKIGRNNSHVTILQAITIDKLSGPPAEYDTAKLPWLGGVPYQQPTADLVDNTADEAALAAAKKLWSALDEASGKAESYSLQRTARLMALRAAIAANAPAQLQSNWRWQLELWNEADREEFSATMARAYAALQAQSTIKSPVTAPTTSTSGEAR